MIKRGFILTCKPETEYRITKSLFTENLKFWSKNNFQFTIIESDDERILFNFEIQNQKYLLDSGVNSSGVWLEVEGYNEKLIYNFSIWYRNLLPQKEDVYVYEPAIKEEYIVLTKKSTIESMIKVFGVTNYI